MKNSSRLELTIERNFTLSKSGFSGSWACSRTLLWNCNKLSSRLMYSSGDSEVRFGGLAGPSNDASVTGVEAPGESFGSSACNSPIEEVRIENPVPLGWCKKDPLVFSAIPQPGFQRICRSPRLLIAG